MSEDTRQCRTSLDPTATRSIMPLGGGGTHIHWQCRTSLDPSSRWSMVPWEGDGLPSNAAMELQEA